MGIINKNNCCENLRREGENMDKMERTGIKPVVLEEIKRIAEEYEVKKVILFGSRARGDYQRASDIDLRFKAEELRNFILDVKDTTSNTFEF